MNTYTNGARQVKLIKKKRTKEHIKSFYKILSDMDEVANELGLIEDVEFNEENINEYVVPIYGRELDPMEKFIVLGKLHYKNE